MEVLKNVEHSPKKVKQFYLIPKDIHSLKLVYNFVCRSIAPSIFGFEDVKKCIACLLFGGSRKRLPGKSTNLSIGIQNVTTVFYTGGGGGAEPHKPNAIRIHVWKVRIWAILLSFQMVQTKQK